MNMRGRYTIVNEYYLRDNITGKYLSFKDACNQLNILETLLLMSNQKSRRQSEMIKELKNAEY